MNIIGVVLIAVGVLFIYNGYLGYGKWYAPVKSALGGGSSTPVPSSSSTAGNNPVVKGGGSGTKKG